MLATPSPIIVPPSSSGQLPARPNPTMNTPIPTTTTAITMEKMVTGTLYLMGSPETANPSMAMKCITQIPGGPLARGARARPAGPGRALVGPRPGGAPEPEKAAHARHHVRERRVEGTVSEVVDVKHD